MRGIDYASRFDFDSTARYERDFHTTLMQLLADLPSGATVAELGAGANPLLVADPRIVANDLTYLRVDISPTELKKGDDVGTAVVADVAAASFDLPSPADLVVSKNLAEHVADGEALLRNVHRVLAPGGAYLQLSPVLYALPFAVNRVIPETLASRLLQVFQPRDRHQEAKFPARYSWCRAPSRRFVGRIEGLGLDVVAARGYFGHNYYARLGPLHAFEQAKSAWLARHPVPIDCAFALYVIRRPR